MLVRTGGKQQSSAATVWPHVQPPLAMYQEPCAITMHHAYNRTCVMCSKHRIYCPAPSESDVARRGLYAGMMSYCKWVCAHLTPKQVLNLLVAHLLPWQPPEEALDGNLHASRKGQHTISHTTPASIQPQDMSVKHTRNQSVLLACQYMSKPSSKSGDAAKSPSPLPIPHAPRCRPTTMIER